jgi:hypothetical protein
MLCVCEHTASAGARAGCWRLLLLELHAARAHRCADERRRLQNFVHQLLKRLLDCGTDRRAAAWQRRHNVADTCRCTPAATYARSPPPPHTHTHTHARTHAREQQPSSSTHARAHAPATFVLADVSTYKQPMRRAKSWPCAVLTCRCVSCTRTNGSNMADAHTTHQPGSGLSMPLRWFGVVWCGVVWYGVVWCGVVWCGVVWCGVVWCGVVWCGVVWCALPARLHRADAAGA